jgi:RimJ/RimL family protein N-acetyltransferase
MEMMMKDIAIRGFEMSEWSILRDIRLKALKENPSLFLGSYEQEARLPDSHWQNLIGAEDGKTFGLFDQRDAVGVTRISKFKDDPSGKTARMSMSYIAPDYRGRGLSRLIYEARLDWARSNGFERVIVAHRNGNAASRAANQAFGFRLYEREEVQWFDGTRDLDCRYELFLK